MISMTKKLIYLFMIFTTINCKSEHTDSNSKILFYHRNILGYEDQRYSDFLAISNYDKNRKKAKELYEIAIKYIDTVKANKVVNSITFMAKDVDRPELYWDSEIWGDEKKNCIVSFWFNRLDVASFKDTLKLYNIVIWKKDVPVIYGINRQKAEMDSILNSDVPLINN